MTADRIASMRASRRYSRRSAPSGGNSFSMSDGPALDDVSGGWARDILPDQVVDGVDFGHRTHTTHLGLTKNKDTKAKSARRGERERGGPHPHSTKGTLGYSETQNPHTSVLAWKTSFAVDTVAL